MRSLKLLSSIQEITDIWETNIKDYYRTATKDDKRGLIYTKDFIHIDTILAPNNNYVTLMQTDSGVYVIVGGFEQVEIYKVEVNSAGE